MTPFNFLSTKTITVFILEGIMRTVACIVQCTASNLTMHVCFLSSSVQCSGKTSLNFRRQGLATYSNMCTLILIFLAKCIWGMVVEVILLCEGPIQNTILFCLILSV